MNYFELKRKQSAVRRELAALDQAVCGMETGHTFKGYVEWGHSGDECAHCHLRIIKLCHYVGCKCALPHSTDPR